MQALQNENKLLKTYIATLEKENDARNQQKNTLFSQIDRLAAQNDRLNALLSKSQIKQANNTTYGLTAVEMEELARVKSLNSSLTIQISGLKQQITTLNSQISSLRNNKNNEVTIVSNKQVENLKTVVSRLTTNIREKQSQILRLSQQKQSLSKQIQQLKQQLSWSSKNGTQVSILKGQIATYKSRISQLEAIQQNFKSYNLKCTQLQNEFRNIQLDLRKKQSDSKLLQTEVKRLEVQNRELRSNSTSPTELSTLMSNKLSLEANLRQLNSKLQWSESARKVAEDEKAILERRIKQFQKESLQNKAKLTQYRFSQDSYRNIEASLHIKQKQMQALQQMINSLKQNKKYLQKTLKQKEDIIHGLQAQLYTFRSSNNQYERQRYEVNDLRLIRSDFERQVANLTRNVQQLQQQNNGLKLEIHNLNYTLIKIKQERDNLIRRINASYQSNAQQKMRHAKDDDLRLIVQRLQAEVEEMRNSTSSKIYHIVESDERMEFNQRGSIGLRDRSPTKGSHAKLINQKEKQILHKSKWQNLQRKINALRSQNQILKKSLF